MGLLHPDKGENTVPGKEFSGFSAKELPDFRRSVQMIFQDPYSSLNPRMRIGDIIERTDAHPRALNPSRTS